MAVNSIFLYCYCRNEYLLLTTVTFNFLPDDLRRSKQNNIAVQNGLYNFGSSSSSSTPSSSPSQSSLVSFNQPSQHQQRQQQQRKSEITSLKPANQYQPPKVTTTPTSVASAATASPSTASPPRYSQINRKTTAAQVTVKPTPFVLASSPSPLSSNSNSMFSKHKHIKSN